MMEREFRLVLFMIYQRHILMPNVSVLDFLEGESEQLLIDLEEAILDFVQRKVFLKLLLVDRILFLFNHVAKVAHVPEIQLAIELITEEKHIINQV